jgi:HEPN domain-containing protein
MIESIQNVHVQALCELASGDESTLKYPLPDYIFGFHAQQTCEKLFKALIAAHDADYPFSHSLKTLLDELETLGEAVPQFGYDFIRLEPFAVAFRYDRGGDFLSGEREAISEAIAQLLAYTIDRILALEAAHPPQPMS